MLPYPRITLPLVIVAVAAGGFVLLRPRLSSAEAVRSPQSPSSASNRTDATGAVADASSGPAPRTLDFSRWDTLAKIKDPTARHRALMDLLAALRPEDFAQAAEKLSALGFAGKSDEMQLLVSAWCTADIHAAAAFALRREVPELISVVAEDWGGRDYDAAVEWALEIPCVPAKSGSEADEKDSTIRDYALARVILPTVEKDPGRALATMQRAMTLDNHIAEQVIAAIMSRCPGIIQGLIGDMPEGGRKQWLTGKMMALIAHGGGMGYEVSMSGGAVLDRTEVIPFYTPGELAFATARIAKYSVSGKPTMTSPRLFLDYALDNRSTATALVESLPASATRENALAGVAAAISLSDGIEAGLACIKDCPDETRGLMLKAWSEKLFGNDPAKVLEASSQLAEYPEGKEVIRDGFVSLQKKDQAAADRWLEANPQFASLVAVPH